MFSNVKKPECQYIYGFTIKNSSEFTQYYDANKNTLVVDQVAVDLFAELGNWLANVSSPYEETSSVRSWVGASSLPACVYIAFEDHLLSSDLNESLNPKQPIRSEDNRWSSNAI
ncbi:hypothetical protein CSKR_112840 [Clonorchis sinensis]|uniref:Uncharacterized protein n=1 Tax=Clonorchis sinensis TaxID=79923 RepID=A0A3R7JIM2_CLOSI|nr:hypothetical protein CSKR_112840 [Clonorchis sinensis]